jgi:hypothetical protein
MDDQWLQNNVVPALHKTVVKAKIRNIDVIGKAIRDFVGDDKKPQFIGYYADYDWVLFCQLQGKMIDLPKGWPQFCWDIKQQANEHHISRFPKQESVEHNALNDAIWTRDSHLWMEKAIAGQEYIKTILPKSIRDLVEQPML